MKAYLIASALFLFCTPSAFGQNVAVKSNLLSDVTTTFNLGAEFGLSSRWTIDLSASYNPWTFSGNRKLKRFFVQPEARYWLCERFNGHFFGVHLLGGVFNTEGIPLPGLNKYDKYECAACGRKLEANRTKGFFTPTKACISIIYLIK